MKGFHRILQSASVLLMVTFAVSCSTREEPQAVTGTIIDAAMNSVAVLTAEGDTVNVSLDEMTDRSEAAGLLLNNRIEVVFARGKDGVAKALKVKTDATYTAAVGRWMRRDNPALGIELSAGGDAVSLGDALVSFTNWRVDTIAGRIILSGQSVCNGVEVPFEVGAAIEADALNLEDGPSYIKAP